MSHGKHFQLFHGHEGMVAKLKIDGRQMPQVVQNCPFCLMIPFTIQAAS